MRAVAKRQREYITGRQLARTALAQLGVPPRPIVTQADRSPAWPQGIVGSISHTNTWCAVAMASSCDFATIGLDIEEDVPLDLDLLRTVCVRSELDWLRRLPPDEAGRKAKIVFSAKEACYKAQYPLTGQFLDFDAFSVRLTPETRQWRATFEPGKRPTSCPWPWFEGRWVNRPGLVGSLVAVTQSG